ncbi:MAG TPA: DNA polymerase III subunit gamma/tau, partial [Fervidobacterium nodosum]|nr:DNA polymerase III subunit gamma/tau [Fervidobacterium nodosum]
FIEATLNNDRELIEKILNDIYIERGDFDTFINQLIEKTLEKKEDNMLKLASDFYNVLKEIRFAEEKLLIARLMFLSIANRYHGKYSNISNVASTARSSQDNVGTKQLSKNIQDEKITEQNENTLPQSEKMPSAQLNESVKNEDIQVDLKREEKEEKHLSQNVSQAKFLKQVTKELLEELKLNGDLSIFVGLSLATVYENEDSIKIIFDKSKQFSYEVIKEKRQEIELLYKNKSGLNRPVEVILSDEITDPVLEKLKMLFDDNKSSLGG